MGLRLCAILLCLLTLCSCANSTTAEGSPPPTASHTKDVFSPLDPQTTETTASTPETIPPLASSTVAPVTTYPITTAPVTTVPPISTAPLTTTTSPVTTTPQTPRPTPTDSFEALERDAKYVAVYDLQNDQLLYTTGLEQQIYPASTTKLLTLLFALTIADDDTVFHVGSEINLAPQDSSKAKIYPGESYTLRDIVAALLLPSGNDAAYTLAATCGRMLASDDTLTNRQAVNRFVEGMNEYAASLGLTDTHFVTPDGYHDSDHVTTLADMLVIARMAMDHPLLAEIMAMPTYEVTDLSAHRSQVWLNSNFLLHEEMEYYYPYTTGCKTGFHTPAGACLIATAQKDGHELMVMIFKCSDKEARFSDAIRFLELGFELLNA